MKEKLQKDLADYKRKLEAAKKHNLIAGIAKAEKEIARIEKELGGLDKEPAPKPAAKPKGGIHLSKIVILWAEGKTKIVDKLENKAFYSFDEFQKALESVFEKGSGYNKVKTQLHFEDGKVDTDRIDIGEGEGDYNPERQKIGDYLKQYEDGDGYIISFKSSAKAPEKKPSKPSKPKSKGKGKSAVLPDTKSVKANEEDDEASCEELLKNHREQIKARRERAKKRQAQGKPTELTPGESLDKVADAIENKVEDKEVTKTQSEKISKEVVLIVKTIENSIAKRDDKKQFIKNIIAQLQKLL